MGEITREQISAIRTYYIGPHKEALRYMVISDILYDALPALLDMAEKALTEPSDPKPTSDLLSRLASAQGEASAQEWYGLGVLLHEAETAIRRLEQAKGGEENVAGISRNATSLGVTAEASEIEELCRRLEVVEHSDGRTGAGTTNWHRNPDGPEAATIIRRLVAERGQWQERESETQEALQAIGEDFGAHGGERRTDAMRRLLTEATARATAAEAEVERLRAALKPFADRASRYDPDENDNNEPDWCTAAPSIRIGDLRRARTALEGKNDG